MKNSNNRTTKIFAMLALSSTLGCVREIPGDGDVVLISHNGKPVK